MTYDPTKSLEPGDVSWLGAFLAEQIEGGHCGEGTVESRARNRHSDRLRRLTFISRLSDGGGEP